MDAEYLKKEIGSCLTDALLEIVEKRPADPIEYLANWLNKYKENLKFDREQTELIKNIQIQQEKEEQERLDRIRILEEHARIKALEEESKKKAADEAAAQAALEEEKAAAAREKTNLPEPSLPAVTEEEEPSDEAKAAAAAAAAAAATAATPAADEATPEIAADDNQPEGNTEIAPNSQDQAVEDDQPQANVNEPSAEVVPDAAEPSNEAPVANTDE